jgi:hypothetical protein
MAFGPPVKSHYVLRLDQFDMCDTRLPGFSHAARLLSLRDAALRRQPVLTGPKPNLGF